MAIRPPMRAMLALYTNHVLKMNFWMPKMSVNPWSESKPQLKTYVHVTDGVLENKEKANWSWKEDFILNHHLIRPKDHFAKRPFFLLLYFVLVHVVSYFFSSTFILLLYSNWAKRSLILGNVWISTHSP